MPRWQATQNKEGEQSANKSRQNEDLNQCTQRGSTTIHKGLPFIHTEPCTDLYVPITAWGVGTEQNLCLVIFFAQNQHKDIASSQAVQNRGCLQPANAQLVCNCNWLKGPSIFSSADLQLPFHSGICFI